jgi:hypothetical protein
MSIFDRFKRPPMDAPEPPGSEGTAPEAADAPAPAPADTPDTPSPEGPGPGKPTAEPPAAEPVQAVVPDAGATMPLSLDEIEAAVASSAAAAATMPESEAVAVPAPVPLPSGPLAPERLTDPDDLPFLGRSPMVIPDRHGDPMDSMGNIFAVAMLLAVGFLVVSLSSFGLSDLLGKGDVTIVKNPGTKGMELITKKSGVISRMRTTTQQAEGIGAAIGTVYKLENGEIVWVPGLPGAGGRTTGAAPSTATSGTYTPPSGTGAPGQIGADGPTVAPTP